MSMIENIYPDEKTRFPARIDDIQTRLAILEKQVRNQRSGFRRNLLDNGAMRVAQQGTSLGGVSNDTTFIDRMKLLNNALGVYSIGNTTLTSFGVPLPVNNDPTHRVYFISTSTADAAPAAGDYLLHIQIIEGQRLQHLLYGTTNAKPVTMSGWVYVTVGGIYNFELWHNVAAVGIGKPITLTAGWNYCAVTFPGNTSSAIPDNTLAGLSLQIWIAAGSSFTSGTYPGLVWQGVSANRAVGQSNAIPAAINRVFAVVDWQLEVGAVATPFEVVDYEVDYERCRRWFQRWIDPPMRGVTASATFVTRIGMPLPIPMRAAPTTTISGVLHIFDGNATGDVSAINTSFTKPEKIEYDVTVSTSAFGAIGRAACMYEGGGGIWNLSAVL